MAYWKNNYRGWDNDVAESIEDAFEYTIGDALLLESASDEMISDYRKKEVLGHLDDEEVAEMIDLMNVVVFRFHGEGVARVGLIAHELQKYYPQAVEGMKDAVDADGNPVYQRVSYAQLTPMLMAMVKLLSRQVSSLQKKVEELKSGGR